MHAAAENDHPHSVHLLVSAFICPGLLHARTISGETALQLAEEHTHYEVAEILRKAAHQ